MATSSSTSSTHSLNMRPSLGLAWIFRETGRDTALEVAKVPGLQGMMRLVEGP